ncbi:MULTISPECIES: GNAT family N-acetyltransferase [unclassified Pseudomonas]|uniref:GNAT family N-acetyltransferase n=1 Tax=unclassified Pseudomonas TaxID=196821 RepID=UPI000C86AF85|nr:MULTISPECIES: GNAT family N-acetyltransferase [unclassified Pseudomonas]PMV18023.1 GNAT family N-acetyltransferase [Pseudomonas sp. FW305-3-2-15-C-TSA2]PMV19773.1 GNAT family N-acetyltransferase [Pseudomonas sp. DP16D-L5]PMV36525.1 GNAT family N-acetyltransferase [Pseudomonas sp. FW305-3-2-15-A-LB2]PMV48988.1 GNAT family N-acetyltransferase [Pseudomonas sp. FW305-3-2-15-C-R2A1]PMV53396.1 GNAT family N-acetyltransferase [Pseudomonas sp. FW305-3-2-15-C-LB1]
MPSIRFMTPADYDAILALMQGTPGISLRDADSREATERYLARNPEMSFVAEADGRLIACVMCGHDGRRGYLQHLLVVPDYRHQGIAQMLTQRCLGALEQLGIYKCHLDVFKSNTSAAQYWQGQGWTLRTDIDRYSFTRTGDENA